jgi:hypothetical protein
LVAIAARGRLRCEAAQPRLTVSLSQPPPDAPLTPLERARMVRAESRRGRVWMRKE